MTIDAEMEIPTPEEIEAGEKIVTRLMEGDPEEVAELKYRLGTRICMATLVKHLEQGGEENSLMWAAFGLGAYVALCSKGLDN